MISGGFFTTCSCSCWFGLIFFLCCVPYFWFLLTDKLSLLTLLSPLHHTRENSGDFSCILSLLLYFLSAFACVWF